MRITCAIVLLINLFCSGVSYSQINITVPKTDNEISLPLKTQQEIDAITLPGNGYTVFNTTTNCINYFLGLKWYELCGSCLPKPHPVAVDSIVQINQTLKVFLHEPPIDSIEIHFKDQNITCTVKDPVITIPLPVLPEGISEVHLQIRTYNACGKEHLTEHNNYTAKIKPLNISPVYEVTLDKVKYKVRDIGNYTWMIDDYAIPSPPKNIPEAIQKRHFYSIKLNENVCPTGWDIPTTKQWEDYLKLANNMNQTFLIPESVNLSIGLRTEGFYSVEEKKQYVENTIASYWAKDYKDGKKFMVNISANGYVIVSEKPELLATKIRCTKAK